MLPSFEIERFRTFSHLVIPRLGRVNLIVGRNGAGKTMLLEALRLYASGGDPVAITDLLYDHDELSIAPEPAEERAEPFLRLEFLFHGREAVPGPENTIRLQTSKDDPFALGVELGAFRRPRFDQPLSRQDYEPVQGGLLDDPDLVPGIVVLQGDRRIPVLIGRSGRGFRPFRVRLREQMRTYAVFVEAARIDFPSMTRQWDSIALREGEERLRECLHILAPVERITAVGDPRREGARMFVVRMAGESEPIPLKSLGDGVVRLLRFALALESAGGGRETQNDTEGQQPLLPGLVKPSYGPILLIDEVENGIHYTVLPELWRFLIKVAKLRDLQVFAATHSWDCVEAFQYAAAKEEESNAVLIRLEKKGDTNRSVTFAGDELAIVTRDGIEVR